MERSAALYDALARPFPEQASYAVSLAYRHPLRDADERARGDAPDRAAHRAVRATPVPPVGQEMHRLIAEQAGHRAIAAR